METPTEPITPYLIGVMPKEKYATAQEFAVDLVKILAINESLIAPALIPLADLKGDKGDRGSKGAQGDVGNTGSIGPAGPAGPQGSSLVWKGAWALSVTYDSGDLVDNGSVVYIAIADNVAVSATEPGAGVDWATVWETFPISSVLVGTSTNDSAVAGNVGEYIETLVPVGSAVSLTTATPANVASIALTAGDWDVEASVNFDAAGATITDMVSGIDGTTATIPTDGSECYTGDQTTAATFKDSVAIPRKRVSLAAPASVFLVTQVTFTLGTVGVFGQINARRVR